MVDPRLNISSSVFMAAKRADANLGCINRDNMNTMGSDNYHGALVQLDLTWNILSIFAHNNTRRMLRNWKECR